MGLADFSYFINSMKVILIGLFVLLSAGTIARDNTELTDSLLNALDQATNQIDKIEITFVLCDAHENIEEQLVYAKYAMELSEDTRNKKYQALSYRKMAEIHAANKEVGEAINWKLKEINQWESTGYKIELANAYYSLGTYHEKMGSSSEAQLVFEESLNIYEKENNFEGVAKVKNRLGILHKNLNDLTNALELYFEALQIEQEQGLKNLEANTLLNIGVIYKLKDEYHLALDFYQKALEKFRAINSPMGIGRTSNNLGNIYRQQGDYEQALTYYNSALVIFKEMNRKSSMSKAYNNIGLANESLGKLDQAIENYEKALSIKLEEGAIYSVASNYSNLGSVYGKLGDNKKAQEYFDLGFAFATKYNIRDEMAELYKQMAAFQEGRGNASEALNLYKKYLAYEDSILKSENNKRLVELQAIYALGEIENENKLLDSKVKSLQAQEQLEKTNQGQLRIIIYGLVVIVLLVGLLLANYYRKLRYIKRITRRLEETNLELNETLISKDEKELLLKEIHHRVKNNLQVINSLLRLQSSKISDPQIEELFKECEARVKSMALVHEELYKTEDLSSVNIREYVEKLGTDLIEAYAVNKKITFRSEVDINFMGIDTLVPLGLMINEIFTNSLKHAFNSEMIKNPEVYIQIEFTDLREYEMRVGDNGSGMPPGINFDIPDSLGLELIQTLTEQLEGTITFDPSKPGTHYVVRFKNLDIKGIIHQ